MHHSAQDGLNLTEKEEYRLSLSEKARLPLRRIRRRLQTAFMTERDGIDVLQRLPPEILEVICYYACTDGGRTACSLSLVSRYVNAVSRAARFHSVSLVTGSITKLRRLMVSLERARRVAQAERMPIPRLRHLCLNLVPTCALRALSMPDVLGFDEATRDRVSKLQYSKPKRGFFGWTRKGLDWRRIVAEQTAEYGKLIQTFLRDIAAGLETLCLFGSGSSLCGIRSRIIIQPFECPCFPRLRELSFQGDEPVFLNASKTNEPLFPALSRLHVDTKSHEQQGDFGPWLANAPSLMQLRFRTSLDCLLNKPPTAWELSLEHIFRK